MQIAILGPLEVRDDTGQLVEVAGARLRTLLTRLAIDAGRPVSVPILVDAVWGDQPPAEENNALQTLVSRLRRGLGDTRTIGQSPAGYRLALDPAEIDAHRFERLAADGAAAVRAGDFAEAARLLDDALAQWRGPALAGSTDALDTYAARLDDLRLAAVVDRVEALLEVDHRAVDVADLEVLVGEHPLHERLAGLLMRALATTGRQADALSVYDRLRNQLADELGADPSPAVQDLHLRLLRGELGDRPAPTRRTNLKAQLTSFVGRDDEVARIGKSLEQNRLVTLVGPGGAGKTRLASEAAARVVDTASDGIWMVELAQVTAGADVPQALLNSLGLRETHLLERHPKLSARDALTRLVEGLLDKQIVVLLDNCEHVIEATARLADYLLAECPDLRVLTTSREPLGIVGEVLLAVPPLSQPAPTASAAEAMEYPAVRLFVDRAAAVRPEFEIDDDSAPVLIDIVRRLDGLPLAIELAAARLRAMALPDIADRLSDRFRLLTGGSRTALPRHRTLRAVVEWSWDLLSAEERRVAEQLSVFPAGVTVTSASAVCDVDDIDDLLTSLVDKSLLQPIDGARRLRMLETIREFGAERLAERGELGEVRRRHADHFAKVMFEAEPHLTSADQLPWFDLLYAERENILAAMRYRCDLGDADGALRIAIALGGYAMMLGEHSEIASWMTDALSVAGEADEGLRTIATALVTLNSVATGSGPPNEGPRDLKALARDLDGVELSSSRFGALLRPAVAFFAEDAELTKRYIDGGLLDDDPWSRAAVRMFSANLAENEGDVVTMREQTEIALAEFRELGERWGLASTLRMLGQIHTLDGNLDDAVAAYAEAMRLSRELSSREDEGYLLGRLADLELRRGNPERAREYSLEAQRTADERGSPIEAVFTIAMLAAVELAAGNVANARTRHRETMRRIDGMPATHPAQGHVRAIVLAIGARIAVDDEDPAVAARYAAEAYEAALATRDQPIIAAVGVTLADIEASTGDPAGAGEMLGAAAALRGADDSTAIEIVRITGQLRAELGDGRFEECYARGKALDRDAAIERLTPR